jgi:hypothetical protein
MAYIPELETNENLALQIAFKVSEKSGAFNFAVSDQALYWPSTKAFAVNDATYFKRIRNNEVRWTPKTGPQVRMDFRRSAGEEKADYESETQTA